MTRVLVCGGRDYLDSIHVCDVLSAIHTAGPISHLLQGGAGGADGVARAWARSLKVECTTVNADWPKHGRAAGPIRNQKMLDDWDIHLVVAFPGGRGTADMVRRAKAKGIRVEEHAARASCTTQQPGPGQEKP